jgi:hypothetical protein
MRPAMLLHIVLPGKCFVADRTVDALLPRVLLAVAGRMAGCRERGHAGMGHGVGTGVFVLGDSWCRRLR